MSSGTSRKIWEHLLECGAKTSYQISEDLGLTKKQAVSALDRMIKNGSVTKYVDENPRYMSHNHKQGVEAVCYHYKANKEVTPKSNPISPESLQKMADTLERHGYKVTPPN